MFNIIAVLFIISPLIISLTIAFAGSKKIRINEIELNKYKRKRFERVRWIFNEQLPPADCPVMLLRGAVLKDKSTGKNMLQLKFINTGTQTIKSAYAVIDFIDDAGDIVAKGSSIQAEYLDINCASKDSFGQKQLLDLGEIGAIHIVITYSKVVFTDGTVWRAGTDGQASKPVQVTLLKNALPPELQNEVSEEIICKPERLGHGLWRCTCGCLVRGTDGDICLNCQQTFVNAQESSSVNTLEKRKQKRIAEQEQKVLHEQIVKKESKIYIRQLILSILTVYLGTPVTFLLIDGMAVIGASISVAIFLWGLSICMCCVSLIATSILVQKVRKDGVIKVEKTTKKVLKIQALTALVPCTINCLLLIIIWAVQILEDIKYNEFPDLFGLLGCIYILPFLAYCSQIPFVRNWLKNRNTKSQEIIVCIICAITYAICLVSIVSMILHIIEIPRYMISFWGIGYLFENVNVLPCIVSIVVAVAFTIYCHKLPIVKDWLTKHKSKKRDK